MCVCIKRLRNLWGENILDNCLNAQNSLLNTEALCLDSTEMIISTNAFSDCSSSNSSTVLRPGSEATYGSLCEGTKHLIGYDKCSISHHTTPLSGKMGIQGSAGPEFTAQLWIQCAQPCLHSRSHIKTPQATGPWGTLWQGTVSPVLKISWSSLIRKM